MASALRERRIGGGERGGGVKVGASCELRFSSGRARDANAKTMTPDPQLRPCTVLKGGSNIEMQQSYI